MQAKLYNSILRIDSSQWDALWPDDYPFTQHAFLAALEASSSVDTHESGSTGWYVKHLTVEHQQTLVAAMPLFIKTHSYGEYVFDWSWADAYYRAGVDYYPKLLNAIPFTPSTGPRVAFAGSMNAAEKTSCEETLIQHIKLQLEEHQYSSFHSLFPCRHSANIFKKEYMPQRFGYQFHWFNQNYQNFDDFLSRFSSRKRKNIKKERQKVISTELEIIMREAKDIPREDWDVFYQLYHRTYLKRSGRAGYLGADFFHRLAETMPKHVLLASAHHQGELVAGALYLRDKHTLYGRYWGTKMDIDGLHFECCYYQGIEYAIRRGIQRFDPGAQGEHKIQRGFTPIKTQSFHYIAHSGFAQAIDRFVKQEHTHIDDYVADARSLLPFKEDETIVDAETLYTIEEK